MLGKIPTKWKQRPDMTIAVDWDTKLQINQSIHHLVFHSRILHKVMA